MAIGTTTVTATLYYPGGSLATSSNVTATRLQGSEQGAVIATAEVASASSHASTGVVSLSLSRNDTSIPVLYKIQFADGKFAFVPVGPNQATIDLGKIYIYSSPAPFRERDITFLVEANRSARLPVNTDPVTIATTSTTDSYIMAPSDGSLLEVDFTSLAALAANDTNYITWTIVNLGQAGAGTTAMLAVSDANTTKATGGTALTAVARRALTVHGTLANLVVVKGDVIRCRATATGTLAGTVTNSQYQLRFTV